MTPNPNYPTHRVLDVAEIEPEYVGERAAAGFLGVTAEYLRQLRARKMGPVYSKPNAGSNAKVLYALADLRAWVEAGRVPPKQT